MKLTPITDKHIALGAKMAEFAGYNMPIVYTTIQEEHQAVREAVGVFDVTHMGEFIVKGKEALDLVQWVTSNNASRLEIGQIQYSCLPNDKGGIVDDLLVYRLPEDKCAEGERVYLLVVNASNMQKDWDWINKHNKFDASLEDISGRTGLLAVQGPKAVETMQSLTDIDLAGMKYYTFEKGRFAGIDNVLVSATGYTGSGGFEIYADDKDLPAIWDAVFAAGADLGIKPIGLGARDTLRLEMGFCLYGNDINDETSPIEAGLGWITKTKDTQFISRDTFAQQRIDGISKKLVAFEIDGRRVPRHDYPIEDVDGNVIGIVTSGTLSPSLGIPIGMGYVEKAFSAVDTEIFVSLGKKRLPAKVVKLPFYKA
jgi:aminomethyltransferase